MAGAPPRPTPTRLGAPVLIVTTLLCVGTVALGAWGALRWTLVPQRLDGTVAWSSPSKDGEPWHELVLEGGTIHTVDTELLNRMGTNEQIHGRHVRTDAWSRTLVIGDRSLALAPSPQFWRTTVMIAGLTMVALVRFVLRFRSSRIAGSGS